MIDFLKSLFGKNWKIKLLRNTILFILFVSIPKLYYGNRIDFDPAKLTEEYEKIVISFFLLYLILEYQKYMHEKNRSTVQLQIKMESQLILPLEKVIELYKKGTDGTFGEAKKLWKKAYRQIRTTDFTAYNVHFREEGIYNLRNTADVKFIDNFFKDYKTMENINPKDSQKMEENVNILIKVITKAYKAI